MLDSVSRVRLVGGFACTLAVVAVAAGLFSKRPSDRVVVVPPPAAESLESVVLADRTVRVAVDVVPTETPVVVTETPVVAFEPLVVPVEIAFDELPAAVEPAGPAVARLELPIRPRSVLTAEELVRSLREESDSVEMFGKSQRGRRRFVSMRDEIGRMKSGKERTPDPLVGPLWAGRRSDLDGLPLLEGDDCKLSSEESGRLATVSSSIARDAARFADAANRFATVTARNGDGVNPADRLLDRINRKVRAGVGLDPSGLHQVLQVAPATTRSHLVAKLGDSAETQATTALVQRALFDLDPDVRALAVEELQQRPEEAYTDRLLAAFDYPWAPAAEHAADALIAMRRTDLVDELREVAARPDPRAPFRDENGVWHARELVRANHLRNCLLCHAPRTEPAPVSSAQPVSVLAQLDDVGSRVTAAAQPEGIVPDPYAPLPRVYYGSSRNTESQLLVRADVTYVWQDFSVVHEADHQQPGWPEEQRFDYFVRTLPVSEEKVEAVGRRFPHDESLHRRAAAYALRTLEALRREDERLGRLVASR